MIKFIHRYFVILLCFSIKFSFAQFITTTVNPAITGKLANCIAVNGLPTVTVKFLSGAGSNLNASGSLVILDPCDTSLVEISINNVRWDNGAPDLNWLHSVYFPASTGFLFQNAILPVPPTTTTASGWVFMPNGCTGVGGGCINNPAGNCQPGPGNGGTAGGPGWYYRNITGTSTNAGCCPGGQSTPSPCDNWGDGNLSCNNEFPIKFTARICNNALTNSQYFLKIRFDMDGNTGCWGCQNINARSEIVFSINIVPFTTTLFSPTPTATPPLKTCTPVLTFSDTLKGGCGNGNTIEWWTAPIGGTLVGTGSPFVYTGAVCAGGTTLYAACCPIGNTCNNRKAFVIPNSCPPPIAISNISITEPTCVTNCGSINFINVTGAIGPVTYRLFPGNITNSTGVFNCLPLGPSYFITVTDNVDCQVSAPIEFMLPVCGQPITNPISYCLNQPAVPLTATLTTGGSNLMWYTTLIGGSSTSIAPTPITTAVGSTIYYVTQMVSGVESTPRMPLVVSVLPLPLLPLVASSISYCKNAAATSLTASGTNLLWYTAATGGIGSATAPTPSTATIGSTTYYVTQSSTATPFCESLRAAITVTIKPTAIATINISRCSNQLPFIWNGQTLNAGGTFTNTQLGANGCDSVTTLILTVKPTATAIVNISKCSNQLPFVWNGQSINLGGAYTNIQLAANGCDSVTTLNFTVKPTTTAIISISKCNNQLPFLWNGQSLSIGGTYNNTQIGANGCDSTTTLNFAVKPTTAATTAISKCSNQIPFIWNGQSLSAGGIFTNTQTGFNGCDSTTTLNFTVNPTKAINIAINKCSNILPFLWNGQSLTTAGTYTNTQTSTNGCDSTTTLTFTVIPGAAATVTASVCSNILPYTWNGQILTLSGTYTNTQPGPGGCDSITTLNFTVKPTSNAALTISVCNNTLPYIWNGQSLSTGGIYTNTQIGSNGCDSTTTLNFTVKPTTAATIAISKCSNQIPFIWNGQSLSASGIFTNTQTGSNGCDSTTTLNFTVLPTKTVLITINKCNNQVPYNWNGQSLSTGGTYTNIQTGSNGCDSTTTLTFIVKPVATATVNVSVCSNTLPYTWNGQSLNASGTYNNTQVAANGCDSITTLNFIVKLVATINIAISKCNNQVPYTWNGQVLNASGVYINTQMGNNGCDSITTLNFTIKPTKAATIDISKCSSQIPFIWNGQTLSASGTFTNTQTGSNGCDSTTTLNFTIKPLATATESITVCSNILPYTWNGQSINIAGTYTNIQTSSNGCDSTTTLNFIVTPTPAAPTTIDRLHCQNTVVTNLTATGTNIKWYTTAIGGSAIPAPSPSTLIVGDIIYYATQTVNNCESPRTALVIKIIATPTKPIVQTPVTYCPGDPALELNATGLNLKWYTTATGGIESLVTPTPSTAFAGTTTYYVSQSTTIGNCEGPREAIVVNVNNNNLNVTINPKDTTICEMQSITYSPIVIPEATTYEWRAVGVPSKTISSINTKVTTVSPLDTASYILKSTLGGCATETIVKVNVIWKPVINAGVNKAICLNDSILLAPVITRKSSDFINYYWLPVDSLKTANEINTIALPKLSTWYTITYVTKPIYGCDFTDSSRVKVTVQPKLIAFAGNDTIAVKDAPHKLRGNGGLNYSWYSPNGYNITNSFSQNALITLSNDANVYLTVKDAIGCAASDSIFIKVYEGPTFYVPNSFTPNGDGLNDIFRVIPPGIASTTYFRVFNRFGELVFETNQWLKGWDGTFKGKEQKAGTYVWMVSGVDRNNKKIEIKGTVNLIR